MYIKKIKLKNFRNYDSLNISFDEKVNLITGENAQGKTNLIEAIYLCAFSRSFRTHNTPDLIKIGHTECSVYIEFVSEELEKNLTVKINKKGKKMILSGNRVVRRTAELLNNLVVIVFSPEDLRLIKESPEKRRNFINKELSQLKPVYYENLKKYNECLRQKNTVLKENRINNDILDVFDMQLAIYGEKIINEREKFIEKISEKANLIQKKISGGTENLKIRYVKSLEGGKNEIYEKILKSREKDFQYGVCSFGPHRDDIEFFVNEKNAKKYGSQGQQRTVALALKLAEIEIAKEVLGEYPVLLLDDVLSELDRGRQNFIFNEIEGAQIFITSTEIGNEIEKKIKHANIYIIKDKKIRQEFIR